MELVALILAAGKGTRMKSKQPKLLHQVAGKPIIEHVAAAVSSAGIKRITLVLGHGREEIQALFSGRKDISYAVQEEQLGTGHAMLQAREHYSGAERILVLAGDTPLLRASTLLDFVGRYTEWAGEAAVLSTRVADPSGYGRVLRDSAGRLLKIVEEKDADAAAKTVNEINSGIYCFAAAEVFAALVDRRVKPALECADKVPCLRNF